MKTIIAALVLAVLSLQAHALAESDLAVDFRAKLLPFLAKNGVPGHFAGAAGLDIEYMMVPAKDPKGVLVISPGKGEPYMKYAEVIYDLQDLGYTIYVIDHRGQGFSGRMLPDPVKSHVEHFQDYVDDFSNFVLNVVKPSSYKNSFLLTHSIPQSVILFLANALELVDLSDSYAPGQKPYNPERPFAGNIQTYSEPRFLMNKDLLNIYPQLRVGGSTVKWVQETLNYTAPLRETDNLLQVPSLMFQAADDQYVLPQGENEVCTVKSSAFCKLIVFPASQHEILQEQDATRDRAFKLIRDFIQANQK
jgi:lysophospholipase